MKKILALLFILAGIAIGTYIGLWWAFIGGIVQFIDLIRAPEMNTLQVAFAVAKVCFASFLGVISGVIIAIPGFMLWAKSKE